MHTYIYAWKTAISCESKEQRWKAHKASKEVMVIALVKLAVKVKILIIIVREMTTNNSISKSQSHHIFEKILCSG